MPRIRTIKPEFWSDEKLSSLDPVDRLTFLGLISLADDFGRVHDNLKVIDAFVFPECSRTVRESLAKLSRMNRIRRGKSSSGKLIIEIKNWSKHQRVDKPQTATALPPIVECGSETDSKTKENQEETDIPEPFANDSRTTDESFATLSGIRDQGSGTVDQGSGNKDLPPKSAGIDKPDDIEQGTWDDWMSVRKSKCKKGGWVVTESAMKLLRSEASKAQITVQEAVLIAAGSNWVSFQARYLEGGDGASKKAGIKTIRQMQEDNTQRAITEFVNGT